MARSIEKPGYILLYHPPPSLYTYQPSIILIKTNLYTIYFLLYQIDQQIKLKRYVNYGLCLVLGGYSFVMLLPYCISSGALGSPDLLLSYSMIVLTLHNTIILIITHLYLSTPKSFPNQLIQVNRDVSRHERPESGPRTL